MNYNFPSRPRKIAHKGKKLSLKNKKIRFKGNFLARRGIYFDCLLNLKIYM